MHYVVFVLSASYYLLCVLHLFFVCGGYFVCSTCFVCSACTAGLLLLSVPVLLEVLILCVLPVLYIYQSQQVKGKCEVSPYFFKHLLKKISGK